MATSHIRPNSIIPTKISFQSILYTATFLGLLVLSVGLVLFITSLHLFTKRAVTTSVANASSDNVSVLASSTKDSMLGLNIANSGLVFLNSAKVISISGDKKIHAVISWGKTSFAWTIETDDSTKFFDAKGRRILSTNVRPGDMVMVTGGLSGDEAEPLIKAEFIRILFPKSD